jgi:molecular chaperone DnaK (HSP70)
MAFYGIDLGTTFSSVALAERGVARLVPLEHRFAMASTVLLDGRQRDAPRVVVGALAAERYRTLCSTKNTHRDVTLVRGSKNYVGVQGPVSAGPPWQLCEHVLGATDVASFVLRALTDAVASAPGFPPVEGVVVTHPQRFRNRERRATAQAVYMAGLRGIGMIPEPDAAAWAYGAALRGDGRDAPFMVFDFGGGTLDVTIMQRTDGTPCRLDALASYGVQLGGLGIDEHLRERILERCSDALGREITLDVLNESSREMLLAAAEGLKIQLNAHAGADVNPNARVGARTLQLCTTDGESLPACTVRVSLGEMSVWIGETVERAMDCATEALHLAGLSWNTLDDTLLVGGSAWLHAVHTRLRALAGGRVRLYDDADNPLNPSTAVAAGAAIFAEQIARGDRAETSMLDYHGVIPDALGVRAKEPDPTRPGERRETLAVLVPALTRVPFEGKKTFRKRGGAKTLPIEVLEGRSLAEASVLGKFTVDLDESLADGAPIDVTLRIGRDGVLSVEIRDPKTGNTRVTGLTDAEGLYADDELDHRRRSLASVSLEHA